MESFGKSRYGQPSEAASRCMKTSSATPRSRATNDSSGSVEPPSAAVRHVFCQSLNWLGDASATEATRFFTGLNAICSNWFNSQNREKLQKLTTNSITNGCFLYAQKSNCA